MRLSLQQVACYQTPLSVRQFTYLMHVKSVHRQTEYRSARVQLVHYTRMSCFGSNQHRCASPLVVPAFCDILAFTCNSCLGILLLVWAYDSISFPSEFFLTASLLINACSSIQTVNTMQSALSQTVLTLMPVDEPPIHLLNQVSISCFSEL